MEIEITNFDYKDFIYNEVLPALKFEKLTTENVYDVYDFIVENYEITHIERNDPKLKFINKIFNFLEQYMEFE